MSSFLDTITDPAVLPAELDVRREHYNTLDQQPPRLAIRNHRGPTLSGIGIFVQGTESVSRALLLSLADYLTWVRLADNSEAVPGTLVMVALDGYPRTVKVSEISESRWVLLVASAPRQFFRCCKDPQAVC